MTITNPLRCSKSVMVSNGTNITLLDTGNYPSYSNFLNQTWTWSGSGAAANWTNTSATLVNSNGPLPGRINQSMAYDGYNVMLYGGQTASSTSGVYQDTWVWNGTVWTQVGGIGFALNAPYGRYNAQAAFLAGSGSNKSLLFGGEEVGQLLNETWLWTGTATPATTGTWTQIAVPNGTGPAGRTNHCLAGSTTAPGTVLLFGGQGTNSQFNDTWTYTAAAGWTQIFPTTSPSIRSGASMCYDVANSQWVMFGGSNEYNFLVETWVYKAGVWTQVSVPNGTGPSGRLFAQMAYDVTNSQSILYGGITATAQYPSNQTWALSGTGTALTWTLLGGN